MIYQDHPLFEKPTNPGAKIWRYLSFTKFVAMLHSGTLRFTLASALEDKHEGTLPWPTLEKSDPEIVRSFDAIRAVTAVNCWHLNEEESAAMWRIYASQGEGLAVQSTYERLTQAFEDSEASLKGQPIYVGVVKYIDFRQEEIPHGNMFAPILYKRGFFEYERELRAVYSPSPTNVAGQMKLAAFDQGANDGIDVPVNLSVLIEHVYVAPTSSDWFFHLVRRILPESFSVKFSGLDDIPQRVHGERRLRRRVYAFPGFGGKTSAQLEAMLDDAESRHVADKGQTKTPGGNEEKQSAT